MAGTPKVFDLDGLLAEESFVRRLARSLLFDDHEVEDVVQETWIQAMRTPPIHRGSTRSWLRRVVTGLASNRRRSQGRRRRHEAGAGMPEVRSVEDVLEREEQRREILDALRELSEPYRNTLLQRFFADRTPADIARETGVPAATVRTHLKRGLDLLRVRLDARHGGDRRAWCLALIPLARGGRPLSQALATTGTLGALVNLKSLAALALLTLLFFLGRGLWDPVVGQPKGGATPPRLVADAAAEAAEDGVRAVVPASRDPLAVPDYAAHLAVFHGRVVTAGGAPVVNASVRLVGIAGRDLVPTGIGPASLGPAHRTRSTLGTHTDAAGRFRLSGVWPRAKYFLRVEGKAAGAAGVGTFLAVGRTPGPREAIDLGDVVVTATGRIHGVVRDEAGAPVAGARVRAVAVPAPVLTTLGLDQFRPEQAIFARLPTPTLDEQGGRASYGDRLASHLRQLVRGQRPEDEADTRLTLLEPLPALGDLLQALPIPTAETDADGGYELLGVAAGTMTILVDKPGYRTFVRGGFRIRSRGRQARDCDVVLGPGESASGVVVDAAGAPVPGAQVRVAPLGRFGFFGLGFCTETGPADSTGAFSIRGLPGESLLVAARATDRDAWTCFGPLEAADDLRLALAPRGTLRIPMRLPAGVDGTKLRVATFAGPALGELGRLGATLRLPVDEDWRWRDGGLQIEGLRHGVYTLWISGPGVRSRGLIVPVPSASPPSVRLERASPAQVRVLDRAGRPVAGAKVFGHPRPAPGWARSLVRNSMGLGSWADLPQLLGYTGADGTLAVADLGAGSLVSVFHPGHGLGAGTRGAAETVAVTCTGAGVIEGTLTDGGTPASMAKWRVVAQPKQAHIGGMPWPVGQATLDEEGRFRIEGLPPGAYRLEARHALAGVRDLGAVLRELTEEATSAWRDDRLGASREVTVSAGEAVPVHFDAEGRAEGRSGPDSRIAVDVLLDGAPAVDLVIEAPGYPVPALSDRGETSFPVRSGEKVTVVIRDPQTAGAVWMETLTPRPGQVESMRVRLQSGRLRGRVTLPPGIKAETVQVHARCDHGEGAVGSWSTRCDATGGFEFGRLVAGTFALRVDSPAGDLRGQLSGLRVGAGANRDVVLETVPLFHLRGTVRDAAPGTWVYVRSKAVGGTRALGVEKGTFDCSGLPPGEYEVYFRHQGALRDGVPPTVLLEDRTRRVEFGIGGRRRKE